ncbi:MAG: immunoglobulin domain-containing protein [Verrucomicrobiota bacterium]
MTSSAGTLIDVAFTSASVTSKTGFAATGMTTNDFWNTCTVGGVNSLNPGSGASPSLKLVNDTASGAGLTVANVGGVYGNGASDPMYATYLYTQGGNITVTVTVTELVAGTYDFYLYGHGNEDNQNSVFQITVGLQNYGSEATTNGPGWLSSVWQEGVQYVKFTNVSVSAGQTITIMVEPGAGGYAVLSGLQMAPVSPSSSGPFVVSQPTNQAVAQGATATFSVVAGGAAPLAYQWLINNTNISAATNSTYIVTNAQPADVGNYSVIITNSYGSLTSAVAALNVITPVTTVIDVAFTTASVTGKTGFAATGVTTNDFWNTCTTITGHGFPGSGSLPNMKFMDGSTSGAGVMVAYVQGNNGNGASDPMYGNYLVSDTGDQYPDISVTVTNLAAGGYDFYLYGHGNEDNQNSVFQITVGSQSYGSEATINGPGWLSSVWQEGVQYVEFTNVSISAGQAITITAETGASLYSVLSGLQMASVSLTSASAFIVTQPENQQVAQGATATFSVVADGAAPLAYQWLFNNASISGATNSSYIVTNAQLANAGNYSVIVTNAYGSITSLAAVLEVGLLINGGFEVPVITSGNDRYAGPGDTWLTGWTIGGTVNEVFLFTGSFSGLNPADGQQWVVFDSQNAPPEGAVYQTFSTIIGETYLVTYSVAPAIFYNGGNLKSLTLTMLASDGSLLASNETAYIPPYEEVWSTVRVTFSARTTNTTLVFTDTSTPAYDTSVALDAVSVVALPTNSPPLTVNVSNQFVNVNQGVIVTNYAYSANGPISFMLASDAPAGASITADGVFTWIPTCEQGSTTNLITVWAMDSGTPPLSNSMTFSVSVGDCVEVSIGSSVVQAGQNTCVPVSLVATVGLTNLNFTLAYPSGFLTNWNITPSNSVVASAAAIALDPSHTQFTFGIQRGQTLQGTAVLGSICLDTLPGASAFVPLTVANISAVASNNSPATNLLAQMGRLVVIDRQSLLDASLGTNSSRALTLYGNPGVTYDLVATTNLADRNSWSTVGSVTLTDMFQSINLNGATNQMQFFRAVQP